MIVKGVTCAKEKNEKVIKLSVEFKTKEEDPLYPKDGGIYTVRYSNCKLVRIGPPNQLFFPPHRENKKEKPRNECQNITEVGEQSDDDSQIKEVVDEPEEDKDKDSKYFVKWSDEFVPNITIDLRSNYGKHKSKVYGTQFFDYDNTLTFFTKFLPMRYIKDHLLPATNKALEEKNIRGTSIGEFLGWLGIWFLMSINPTYSQDDFFSLKERNIYWNPPFLGSIMSGKRFKIITEWIRLTTSKPPEYRDRFFLVRDLIYGFNEHMAEIFSPSWIVCVDESMVVFYNKYAPGWVAVKRKPHPLGNEYHTTACCETKIIFIIELVQGKDAPKEGPYSTNEFEEDFQSKIAALCVRMTRSI